MNRIEKYLDLYFWALGWFLAFSFAVFVTAALVYFYFIMPLPLAIFATILMGSLSVAILLWAWEESNC